MSPPPSPSGEAAAGLAPALTFRTLCWVAGAVLIVRLAAAGLIHLTEDEAYYRLWSFHLAAGYYDHPPMIAWWVNLGRHVAGDDALGVRLLPVLASVGSTFLVWDMARLAGASEQTAVRAGVWYNATLLVGLGAMLAVPDAPASLFWQTALWGVLRALKDERRAWAWWVAAGAAAGLATLSKYSALFLAPGILLVLILTPRARAQLKTPWPWLACVIAAALFAINVGWNAEHGWLTFHKQFGRVAPHGFSPAFVLELIVGQAFLLNPLIAAFAWRAFAPNQRFDGDARLFAYVSAPFMAYLVLHSLHDRVQAGWPAPIYPALAIAAAMAAAGFSSGSFFGRLRMMAPVLGFAVTLAALAYAALPLPSGKSDLAEPVRGWPLFADRLEATRLLRGARWIGTLSYGQAAELAAEHEIHAPVLQLTERERYPSETSSADLSKPGLVVDLARRSGRDLLANCFANVTPLGEIDRTPARNGRYLVYLVSSPKRLVDGGCDEGRAATPPR
jgi:4-amino-4-deoxy-L-arabinose transferase-like glycosyltransferase